MKKLVILTGILLCGNISKSQNFNCQAGVGQLEGVVAWKGKKLSSSATEDPSNGTMTFKVTCDRTIDGTCFYADNGRSDTIVKKICEGIMNPNISNVNLYDEFHQRLYSGTLQAYLDNPVAADQLWIREYTFYFK
jgi:hypothetical protein